MKSIFIIPILVLLWTANVNAQSIKYDVHVNLGFLISDTSFPGHAAVGVGALYKEHFGLGLEVRVAGNGDGMSGGGGYLTYVHRRLILKSSFGKVVSASVYNDFGNLEEYISGGTYFSFSAAYKFDFGLFIGFDFTKASGMDFKVVDFYTNELVFFTNDFMVTSPMIGYYYQF